MTGLAPLAVVDEVYQRTFGPEQSRVHNWDEDEEDVVWSAHHGTVCLVHRGGYGSSIAHESDVTSTTSGWLSGAYSVSSLVCEASTLSTFDICSSPTEELGALGLWLDVGGGGEHTPQQAPSTVPQRIYELRRNSGLGWQQLADMLGVSRRSLHNWANGKEISLKNEQRLARALATIQEIDRGTSIENRRLLLEPVGDGRTLLDLFCEEQYDRVISHCGKGVGRLEKRARRVDEMTLDLQTPQPLSVFVEHLDEPNEPSPKAVPSQASVRKPRVLHVLRKAKREG